VAWTGARWAAAAGARGSELGASSLHGGKELRETRQLGTALHAAEVVGPELYLARVAGRRARAR
jgi:hypothetical protein